MINRPQSKQFRPENAQKVFSGEIFDVYQWEQPVFDGTTKTFEQLKRADTVVIIPVTADKKIVILHQEQPGKEPFWGLAGGRIETGEEVMGAAKRELTEETGYKAKNFKLLESFQPYSKIDWAIYTLIGQECQKKLEPTPDYGEKILEVKEVSFEEFSDLVMSDDFYETNLKIMFMKYKLENKLEELKNIILS